MEKLNRHICRQTSPIGDALRFCAIVTGVLMLIALGI